MHGKNVLDLPQRFSGTYPAKDALAPLLILKFYGHILVHVASSTEDPSMRMAQWVATASQHWSDLNLCD